MLLLLDDGVALVRQAPVEQVTEGRQGAVILRIEVLAHLDHAGVEVADPGEDGIAVEFPGHDVLLGEHDQRSFHAFALPLLGHAEDDAGHGLHGAAPFVPEELQLADPVEVAVHMLEDLIQLGQADVHGDGPVLVTYEDQQARVHHGLHGLHDLERRGLFHGLMVLMIHPGGVVHGAEIRRDLLYAPAAAVVHADVRVVLQLFVLPVEDGLRGHLRRSLEEELIEPDLKAIALQ